MKKESPRYTPIQAGKDEERKIVRLDSLPVDPRGIIIFPATQGAKPFSVVIVEKRSTKQSNNPKVVVDFYETPLRVRRLSLGGGTSAIQVETIRDSKIGDFVTRQNSGTYRPKAFPDRKSSIGIRHLPHYGN